MKRGFAQLKDAKKILTKRGDKNVQDMLSGSGRVQDTLSGSVQDTLSGSVQDTLSGSVQDTLSGSVQDKLSGSVQDTFRTR